MEKMLNVKEMAQRWCVAESLVSRYCREDRIPGVYKEKGAWVIPADAKKPIDKRLEKKAPGVRRLQIQTDSVRKPLPVGISSYKQACRDYYYVDKTLLLKDFIDERPKVSLFTRPRRFGKTLTMDMVKTFFEISAEDTAEYFLDKQIWACGEYYQKFQGKYPVIFMSFKDIKCDTWEETYKLITQIIQMEFSRHKELFTSDKITFGNYYHRIVSNQAEESEYAFALKYLSQMLREHYGIAPVIIIDEYDTPIQQGHTKDFYNKVIVFMRNFFSGGLKDNDENLSFGVLTGILRVAKESIFSGLNNLNINSILDQRYSEYFGFTAKEVQEMANYYGVPDMYEQIASWYDGYRFGKTDIFNPWSVINYFNKDCKPGRYWENTSDNAIISELLDEADGEIYENLNALLQGQAITTYVDTNVIYPEIRQNPSSVYSFLLVVGYLKIWEADITDVGDLMCRVSLPNKEVAIVYKKEIINRLQRIVPQSVAFGIQEAIYEGDPERLQKQLRRFLLESVSCYDTQNENSYHMLLLGMCAIMSDRYYLSSNRESGEGRFDIQLQPKEPTLPGILIEVKAKKDCQASTLEGLARQALEQIEEKKYDVGMRAKGVKTIIRYGVAFSGKEVQIAIANV